MSDNLISKGQRLMKNLKTFLLALFVYQSVWAADIVDKVVTVNIDEGTQQGVISYQKGKKEQDLLIVLVPGSPSVFRPVVNDEKLNTGIPVYGNFVIRSREYLIDEKSMTLVVDCYSKIGDVCTQKYQASKQRFNHLKKLIDDVKINYPSIREVWLMGTSFGTITSGFSALHGKDYFFGAIHSATINPTAEHSYPILSELDYKDISSKQIFVHHKKDDCSKSDYKYISDVSKAGNFPLVSVSGGYGWKGDVCQAMTAHGFKGKEEDVMKGVLAMIRSKQFSSKDI
jgi:alpha/beta superfamily hydrolase